MNPFRSLLSPIVAHLRDRLRRDSRERDLDDELRFHLEMEVENNVREGMSPAEARRRALLAFGGVQRVKDETREAWGIAAPGDLARDVRLAARALRRSPGFAAVALLTLGLGVGASTAIFTLVNAALLRPLPFEAPERLVAIWGTAGPERAIRGASYPELMDWREQNRSLEDVVVYDESTLSLSGGGEAALLESETVSPGFFEMLGVAPARGRVFGARDDVVGAAPAAVVSHELWRDRFGADPALIGRTLTLDGTATMVIGIMPPGFRGLSFDTEIWVTLLPTAPGLVENRGTRWLMALGRLKPGVDVEAAQADLGSVADRLRARYPDLNDDRHATLFPLRDYYLGNGRTLMHVLLGAVAFLLLIACVNVTNLQLVRGVYRRRETAVRHALGARRLHVVRERMAEALVLAFVGGALGLVLARVGVEALAPLVPDGVLPSYAEVGLDVRAFAFALAVTLLAGLVAGALPALSGAARRPADALRGGGGGSRTQAGDGGPGGHMRLHRMLVAGEVAMALALMVGAGLMVRSLRAQLDVEPGFRADGVLAARLYLPPGEYGRPARVRFVDALVERVHALPGAADVAVGFDSPLRGNSGASYVFVEGRPDERIRFYRHHVSPAYFRTLGIPIVRGRGFTAADADEDAPGVAVISRAFARRWWPDGDPVGERLRLGSPDGSAATIVGVAGDARFRDLTTGLMDPASDPDVYFAYAQIPTTALDLVVRSSGPGPVGIRGIREAVAALDPALPVFRVEPLADALARQTAGGRFGSFLLGVFAALALALAAVGVYGVMAFLVGIRRREIAIRLAVGAAPRAVLGLVLRQGMTVVAVGAVAGIGLALAGGRYLEGLLFGVRPTDPRTFALVCAVMLAVAVLANLLPAYRATRVDPQRALQAEG